ncbi:MAG: hypothetical protein Q7R39_20405, partial [Dehalococcoidia bacterium]|nr:hypothetical protein [Dehalococcoidia bacterium]
YFGMTDTDFTIHPVYFSYMKFANEPPVLHYGYRQEDDRALTYRGTWQTVKSTAASLGSFRRSAKAGDSVEFAFKGTSLDLISREGPDAGRLFVTIDGDSHNANFAKLDEKGRTYLDLYADVSRWQVSIPIVNDLPDGVHRVTLTVAEDGRPVAIDGLVVQTGATYLVRVVGLGLFFLVVLGLAGLAYRGRRGQG